MKTLWWFFQSWTFPSIWWNLQNFPKAGSSYLSMLSLSCLHCIISCHYNRTHSIVNNLMDFMFLKLHIHSASSPYFKESILGPQILVKCQLLPLDTHSRVAYIVKSISVFFILFTSIIQQIWWLSLVPLCWTFPHLPIF